MGNTESPGALFPHPKSSLRSSAIFPPLKIKYATWRTFLPSQKSKTVSAFR